MGNWRYRHQVSSPAQALAEQGMYFASVFAAGADAPPEYPKSARLALDKIKVQLDEARAESKTSSDA
jgi:hypothetical protein